MIMYVFDKRWPGQFRPATTHKPGTRVIWFTVDQNWNIAQIALEIRRLAGGERTIWLLRLCAHGNAGKLVMGEGLDVTTVCFFSPLRGYFTPDGRGIEVHGCAVASASRVYGGAFSGVRNDPGVIATRVPERALSANSPHPRLDGYAPATGYTFLKALANATGTRVTAGYDIQNPDLEFRWEGREILQVAPD